ncbi:MAG: hypothetical protein A2896_02070 [Candidatus Nealsonbacteria bacterium RIFCSPLOWO2_01_FULL_43_32]|uniref:Cell division protein FtsL n=1 Tax=Candidatus Nealsonbacteria bacterium RIFCSPLOWO2_01_FULL_43_32 TaxID=1801672 RepID=A0A1G2EGN5_9BACT|nr:MAG: hypothetical protein A2896_02070 [Candidatus Nealsonbacteria bacterium RIFCSPLOWO2_01_FULL_43_32]
MVAKAQKIRKGKLQNLFFSILLGVLFFGVVSALVVSNWKINQKRAQYTAQIKVLQAQLQELELKREQLQAQISQTSDEVYLETQARETFNLKKLGEEVVAVLPAEEEIIPEQEKGFWGQIWDKIKFW